MSGMNERLCQRVLPGVTLLCLPLWLFAGCYSPEIKDCQFTCALVAECPDGFTCNGGYCVRKGVDPSLCGSSADVGVEDVRPRDGGEDDGAGQEDIQEDVIQEDMTPEVGPDPDLEPPALTVASLGPESPSVDHGAELVLDILLSARAPQGGAQVTVLSNDPAVVVLTEVVTVPAGEDTAPVTVRAEGCGGARITASLDSSRASTTVDILPTMVGFEPSDLTLKEGEVGLVEVILSCEALSQERVRLQSSPTGLVSLDPLSYLNIDEGSDRGQVSVSALKMGEGEVTAELRGEEVALAVTVQEVPACIAALSPETSTVVTDRSRRILITLDKKAPPETACTGSGRCPEGLTCNVDTRNCEMVISLASNNEEVAYPLQTSVVVSPGDDQAFFDVQAVCPGDPSLIALLIPGCDPSSVEISVIPSVGPLEVPQSDMVVGQNQEIVVSLMAVDQLTCQAHGEEVCVDLSQSEMLLDMPQEVCIPDGRSSASVEISAISPGATTLTAKVNGTTASTIINVNSPPLEISAVSLLRKISEEEMVEVDEVLMGTSVTMEITLSQPAPPDTRIILTSDLPGVAVPQSSLVRILEGETTAQASVGSRGCGGPASLTATLGQSSRSAPLSVLNGLETLTPISASCTAGQTTPLTVDLLCPGAGASVALASSQASVASVPRSVTMEGEQASFDVTCALVGDADITATLNTSATSTVTVNPSAPTLVTLSCLSDPCKALAGIPDCLCDVLPLTCDAGCSCDPDCTPGIPSGTVKLRANFSGVLPPNWNEPGQLVISGLDPYLTLVDTTLHDTGNAVIIRLRGRRTYDPEIKVDYHGGSSVSSASTRDVSVVPGLSTVNPATVSLAAGVPGNLTVVLTESPSAGGTRIDRVTDPLDGGNITIGGSSSYFSVNAQPAYVSIVGQRAGGPYTLTLRANDYPAEGIPIVVTITDGQFQRPEPTSLELRQGETGTVEVCFSATEGYIVAVEPTKPWVASAAEGEELVIPAGQDCATLHVRALAAGSETIRLTYGATVHSIDVTVFPGLDALTPCGGNVAQGGRLDLTLCLTDPTPRNLSVALTNPDGHLILHPTGYATFPQNGRCLTVGVEGGAVAQNDELVVTLDEDTLSCRYNVVEGVVAGALYPQAADVALGYASHLTFCLSDEAAEETTADLTTVGAGLDVPDSVTVPMGRQCVDVPVWGQALGQATLTASVGGSPTVQAQVRVVPPLEAIVPSLAYVTEGATSEVTIRLAGPAPAGGVRVDLASSDPTKLWAPSSIMVEADSGQVTIGGIDAPYLASIDAFLGGSQASGQAQVVLPGGGLAGLGPQEGHIVLGDNLDMVVCLNDPALANETISLATSPFGMISLPASVTIPEGDRCTTFVAQGLSLGGPVTLQAEGMDDEAMATLYVVPAVMALTPAEVTVFEEEDVTLTVELASATPVDVDVALQASPGIELSVDTVTVLANDSQAEFIVTALYSGTVTASLGGSSAQSVITARRAVNISSVTPADSVLLAGETVLLTVELTEAVANGATILLESSDPLALEVPAEATVEPGQSSVDVLVTALAPVSGADVTATTQDGSSMAASVSVYPPLLSCSPNPLIIDEGHQASLSLVLAGQAPEAMRVGLDTENAQVANPVALEGAVPTGGDRCEVPILGVGEGGPVEVTGTLLGHGGEPLSSSLSCMVQVREPVFLQSLLPETAQVCVGGQVELTVGLQQPISLGEAVVELSSHNPLAAQPEGDSLTIAQGQGQGSFMVNGLDLADSVTISASYLDDQELTAQVTVVPGLGSLAPSELNLTVSETWPMMVCLTHNAPDTTEVTLQADVLVLSVPPTVTVAQGNRCANFLVNAQATGSTDVTATLMSCEVSVPAVVQ